MDAKEMISALEPIASDHGLELVDIEFTGPGKSPTVRVFLDTAEGITFDEIVAAHTWIDAFLEQRDPFPGAYTLEVSSPGIDRHLRTLEHFERFAGEQAVIVTGGLPGRSNWTGTLEGVDGEDVLLRLDGTVERIPYGNIRKAHVKGVVDFDDGKDS